VAYRWYEPECVWCGVPASLRYQRRPPPRNPQQTNKPTSTRGGEERKYTKSKQKDLTSRYVVASSAALSSWLNLVSTWCSSTS
jgi:hypothetical protein